MISYGKWPPEFGLGSPSVVFPSHNEFTCGGEVLGFPGGSDGKESACSAGDLDSIPELERSLELPVSLSLSPANCKLFEDGVIYALFTRTSLASIPVLLQIGTLCLFVEWINESSLVKPGANLIIVKYTLENARGSPSSYFSESSKEKKVKGLTFKRCPCIRNIGNIKKQN